MDKTATYAETLKALIDAVDAYVSTNRHTEYNAMLDALEAAKATEP